MSAPFAIEVIQATKTFGSVVANDNVSFAVSKGEILALLGENGSGKTTLVNLLSGIYDPDGGSIRVNGKEAAIRSPRDAHALKIGMIHQHFKLVDRLTAAENIVLGLPGGIRLSRKEIAKEVIAIGDKYGFLIAPEKKVYRMSVSEKQTVEIVKALYQGADILILDEPTAVLTPKETERLFVVLKTMRDDGKTIILITHKLNEVLAVSDRVMVMRKGRCVDTVRTKNANMQRLTDMMVGHPMELTIKRKGAEVSPLLSVTDLTVRHKAGHLALHNVSFDLHGGEILGVAGVAGSGQRELCEALTGICAASGGRVVIGGENIVNVEPDQMRKKGVRIGFIPEDRLGMGLVGALGITENLLIRGYHKQGFALSRKPALAQAKELIRRFHVDTTGPKQKVSQLSGGNVQKVLLGRELMESPQVIIAAYPVRGLDIGASYMVYDLLQEQKANGVGVLFVGEDLDVMLELCDRILVLCGGQVTGIVDAKTATKEQIGGLMTTRGMLGAMGVMAQSKSTGAPLRFPFSLLRAGR